MNLEMPSEIPEEATTSEPTVSQEHKLSAAAIVGFLLVVISLASIFLLGQSMAWFLEQIALSSASVEFLSVSGKLWFVGQIVLTLLVTLPFFYFSQNTLRPIYKSWLLAILLTIPTFVLRLIGPNQDQLGAVFQIVIGLLGGGIVLFLRWRSLDFNLRSALAALMVLPLVTWPFLLWGAPGSPMDILLNLLAGLSFGLLAASLMAKTTDNFLLDSLGAGILLGILSSGFGYDGEQLLLVMMLPAFGFALTALAPSIPGMVVGLGLLTAAALIYIDPTELSIVLGDFFPVAMRIATLVMVSALGVGLLLWLVGKWRSRPRTIAIPLVFGLIVWSVVVVLYGFFGIHGFYGDRLFVILKEQADLTPLAQITDPVERKTEAYAKLTKTANRTQAGLRETLDTLRIGYTPYYLVNAIEVDDNLLLRLYLATRPEVDRVINSPRLRELPEMSQFTSTDENSIIENPGWNIKMIGADRVWDEFNVKGQGILVGQADSGVDGKHPALRDTYRGKTNGDDFNWYDPWYNTASPTDGQGHGTHTLGTVLGQDGIGVAPDAQWIGCVNLGRNLANPALYLDCMQFLFAPFPQNGDSFKGEPARGAQVFNNSWGCPPIEGCDANALKPGVDALRAAGVFVVVSTGNDGPACKTVNTPLALYDSVFSVGAVNSLGEVVEFSSRGPVTVDGSERTKPDIVAPGADIFSSMPGGSYASNSGTSMAGPHLVGVVALMWSANPALIGDIEHTEQILTETAQPVNFSDACSDDVIPNNTSGYGLVDAYTAVKMALGK